MDEEVGAPAVHEAYQRALRIGARRIRAPMMGIFLVGILLLARLGDLVLPQVAPNAPPPPNAWIVPIALSLWLLFVGALALLWRSYMTPRWRVWAMETVPQWAAFERLAISNGLLPDKRKMFGRLYAWAEIWTKKLRAREAELLRAQGLPSRNHRSTGSES